MGLARKKIKQKALVVLSQHRSTRLLRVPNHAEFAFLRVVVGDKNEA